MIAITRGRSRLRIKSSYHSPILFVCKLYLLVTKGAYHANHVHEGVLVSGVYYAAVPSGSAPLVLRRPKADDTRLNESQSKAIDEVTDVVLSPEEGNLVLFPPWVEHGVPVAEEQHPNDSNNLPRVSFAFNVTGAFALGNDLWNATRFP